MSKKESTHWPLQKDSEGYFESQLRSRSMEEFQKEYFCNPLPDFREDTLEECVLNTMKYLPPPSAIKGYIYEVPVLGPYKHITIVFKKATHYFPRVRFCTWVFDTLK